MSAAIASIGPMQMLLTLLESIPRACLLGATKRPRERWRQRSAHMRLTHKRHCLFGWRRRWGQMLKILYNLHLYSLSLWCWMRIWWLSLTPEMLANKHLKAQLPPSQPCRQRHINYIVCYRKSSEWGIGSEEARSTIEMDNQGCWKSHMTQWADCTTYRRHKAPSSWQETTHMMYHYNEKQTPCLLFR